MAQPLQSYDSVSEPIPISFIAGRYLLFDVNVVTHLRRTHHICGVLLGSIPQVPQQNVFLGLPVELMPEEALLLVQKEVAYIIDDTKWHNQTFGTLQGDDRKRYLESLRAQGLKAKRTAEDVARQKSKNALAKQASARAKKQAQSKALKVDGEVADQLPDTSLPLDNEVSLFGDERPTSRASSTTSPTNSPYAVTPTTTYEASLLPVNPSQQPDPSVPASFPLYAHLHAKDYFIMPGLRFGCDYNVYPGDPLRFHSHFLAVGYEWDQEIPMLDLIGGGRLGTAVKKGFLIGGQKSDSKNGDDAVRAFSIEWAGM